MRGVRWMAIVGSILVLGLGATAPGATRRPAPKAKQEPESRKSKDPPRAPGPKTTEPAQLVAKGPILVVRGMRQPEPQLTDEQGTRFLLTGPWRSELLRLQGHVVQVWGEVGRKKLMQRTIDVARYEIVDSGAGRKPLVGWLRRQQDGRLTLDQREGSVPLKVSKSLHERLAQRVSCKVWIVGDLVAGELVVSKAGWLSCPNRESIKPNKEGPK